MQTEQGVYSKRRLAALGVLVILIFIVLFLLWWWFVPKGTPGPGTTDTVIPPGDRVILPTQTQVLPPPADTPALTEGEEEILSLARNFAERYGSWSTDAEFQNLIDLFPRITARLRNEFEDTIAAAQPTSGFKGVVSTVLRMEIQSRTNSTARVLVTTQRVETGADLRETVTYHDLVVTMVRQGEFWYVNEAEWQI